MSKAVVIRVGLGIVLGAAAGIGLIFYFYKQKRKKPSQKNSSINPIVHCQQNAMCLNEQTETVQPHYQVPWMRPEPVEGGDNVSYTSLLTHEEQAEVLNRLDFVLRSLIELRHEVEELRNSLQSLAGGIVGEVRSHLEESQKVIRRRRFMYPRERSDSTGSSSIYFTASSGAGNTDDGESEGGYTTANAESDYDRESDKESDEGEDEISCETVRTGRRDSLDLVNEDEAGLSLDTASEEELAQLLHQADSSHRGTDQEKKEGFQLLLNNKLVYGDKQDFLWRLARAYSDIYEITEDTEEKESYACDGKEEAKMSLQLGDQNAECHKWYAILCGQCSEHETIQKRIQAGHVFKKHIDEAIALKPDDPMSYYLRGRWCYQVAHLGWLERKTASALYEEPPLATVQDALQNFLKAEDLNPGFSKVGRIYIAKCFKELGDNSKAAHWLTLASELPVITKEDAEGSREMEEMQFLLTKES
ncbi:regulator of microtubule dynamics protein 3 [Erythrolamprus reginae]|uniref:regulator of microtubule dynamics protein 3 n=1 Tax=Erythrolamprus reginae TaxID=121349 RepID=UPI00396C7EA4